MDLDMVGVPHGGDATGKPAIDNAAFDASLKARSDAMGIRDTAAVDALARGAGFDLVDDIAMPANNRIRLWQRRR